MYGVIFDFLREYVIERHGGKATWEALLKANGFIYKVYFPVKEYPDEDIVKLAVTASEALKLPLPVVLEDFGSYVGPRLLSFYSMYVKHAEWRTFEIVENAGSNIHDTIHRHNPQRNPPQLSGTRESDRVLTVRYKSHRKMCPVVRGILRGLGEHFHESLTIQETQCMHQGASECVMRVTKV